MRRLFKKEFNPYTVSDKVTFRNVEKTITVYVRSDATSLIVNLKRAQEKLKELTDQSSEKERMEAARVFASAIFGEKEGDRLCKFYGEPMAIVSVCGIYFDERLKDKITKAQKR